MRFPRFPWRHTHPALILGGLALVCFAVAMLLPTPWEGDALRRVARGLEVPEASVSRCFFFDFARFGALQLPAQVYRQAGLWQGAMLAGLVCAAAAFSARWWWPVTGRVPRSAALVPASLWRASRLDWLLLGGILGLAIWQRVPYMDRAIYFDEQDNLRRNFHGHTEIRPDGTSVWRGADWTEALWENRLGNNPVLLSAATQVTLRTWRWWTGADRERFSIVAVRLPVVLAGVASVAALWWLLQIWGLRLAAAIGAGLAAVHPMHVDYSLQARGYAFVLLLVPVALGLAWLSLRTNRWRHWLAFAVAVMGCLLAYPGSVHFALAINAGALLWLIRRRLQSGDPGDNGPIARLLAANAVTATAYAWFILPHVPQMSHHFREVFELIALEPYWWFYAWSHYSTGTNFPAGEDVLAMREGTMGLGEALFLRFAVDEPVLAVIQWVVLPALVVMGVIWLNRGRHRQTSPAALVLTLALAAPVMALIHQQFTSLYFYYWYLTYALPAVIAGIAVGLARLIHPLLTARRRWPRVVGVLLIAEFFVLFIWQSLHQPAWNRAGRIPRALPWPVNADGVEAVEFQRGRHLWITTRDGLSICRREVFAETDGKREGRQ